MSLSYDELFGYQERDHDDEPWNTDFNFTSEEDMEISEFLETNLKSPIEPKFINNQDYTLNSPLISDELESYLSYATKRQKNILHYTPSWIKRDAWVKAGGISLTNLNPIREFHSYCASLWLKDNIKTTQIKDLIKKTDDDSSETFEIVRSYLFGWLNKEYVYKSRIQNNRETLKYGAYMLDSLKITWILNASTIEEQLELIKSTGCQYLNNDEKTECLVYESPLLGPVLIGHGIVIIKKDKIILDRNMLLMFKDTSAARFHTLFAIEHRYEDLYKKDHMNSIISLYKIGDKILKQNSTIAYEVFALVEPLSSLQLAELAKEYRPLIPEFSHFKDYLSEKTTELSINRPQCSDFFQLIKSIKDKKILLTIYGSFRHWGHPFIDYLEGLAALHKNVTSDVDKIDVEYANILASDLAYKILRKEFQKTGRWFVDPHLLPDGHVLKAHIMESTWPSIDTLYSYPDDWHKLPLLKCWEIPEVIDPAIIYSDKTHSIDKDELIRHLKQGGGKQIPTKKVLETLIRTKSTNWPVFLQSVDKDGLPDSSLVIGLKAKEREIKRKGRFFALMSWQLREYFVLTEYLIKQKVIPLFSGLTMADDQTTLTKKLINNTRGQGGDDYSEVTIANHFDYEKWNNFQRYSATEPVFTVLGKFFGLPNLFSRTHEFFERSLIYYRDRPDLMTLRGGQVVNINDKNRVCWNGQLGGLEGLRQKGWSVLNLLVIERESSIRNTAVKILAQGDNQVICTQYSVPSSNEEETLREHLSGVKRNNDVIIDAIRSATKRIGLRINEKETLQSADILLYGKIIIFRGNITCLEEKRYSRITCTTNDQLPSLSNVMSTVSTNCLTVSHYSKSPINPIMHYNWISNFVINLVNTHNPALRCGPSKYEKLREVEHNKMYRIGLIYLDPSIGGISGMSLTRFQIRMFPDPVTEALSFWKKVHQCTKSMDIRKLCVSFGNPKTLSYKHKHFEKLLEDPASLNLPKGISSQNLIKGEIKRALLQNCLMIKNDIIKEAISYVRYNESGFVDFLSSIKPCFPRFLSEFKSATFFGLTNGIIGLFENSKTIRNLFKKKFQAEVDKVIVKCELSALVSMVDRVIQPRGIMWTCSATQADELRRLSWSQQIIGMTIPHPSELISRLNLDGLSCKDCEKELPRSIRLVLSIPEGMSDPENTRGPFPPYLGSSTNEFTSLIQSWEKDTDISFIKKASNMRRALHWFVDPNSLLGIAILNNLRSLTGVDPGEIISGFKRTGSALHRFGCSRISAGGFSANNTVYGSRMFISTDPFLQLGDDNYDFMYQSLMLYAQQTSGIVHNESDKSSIHHYHINCVDCLRKIKEETLDTKKTFQFKDMSQKLDKWKPEQTPWFKDVQSLHIKVGKWESLNKATMSREVGLIQGLIYGALAPNEPDSNVMNNLFPHTIKKKLNGDLYFQGLIDGIYRAAGLSAIHRRSFYHKSKLDTLINTCYRDIIKMIAMDSRFIGFIQSDNLLNVINSYPHKIPPSYPSNNRDLGSIVHCFLKDVSFTDWRKSGYSTKPDLWIFADVHVPSLSGLVIIGYELALILGNPDMKKVRERARTLRDILISVRSDRLTEGIQGLIQHNTSIKLCDKELRHALKYAKVEIEEPVEISADLKFDNQVPFDNNWCVLNYSSERSELNLKTVPRIQNPLVSGIRIPQIATGSFLKMQVILKDLGLSPKDIICGGDGSGGISALLLRTYQQSRLIFNSLIDLDDVDLNGVLPSPPSAINHMSNDVRRRCVNLLNAWECPMDLSQEQTWNSFKKMKKKYKLSIDLLVLDMEITNEDTIVKIEELIIRNLSLFERSVVMIIKTYVSRLQDVKSLPYTLGPFFHNVIMVQNEMSSSNTSEIYMIFKQYRTDGRIKLYPHWEESMTYLENLYCFKTYEEEFKRALYIMKADLTIGIPAVMLPNFENELLGIWDDLTTDKVRLNDWFSLISKNKKSFSNYSFMTLVFLSNQIINSTRWINKDQIDIPSDQKLSKFFSIYIGTMLYISLVNKDLLLARRIQSLIDQDFPVYFGLKNLHKKADGEDMYTTFWSLIEPKHFSAKKTVSVKGSLSLIGAVLRYSLAISKREDKLAAKEWDSKIKSLSKNTTLDQVISQTGLFDVYLM